MFNFIFMLCILQALPSELLLSIPLMEPSDVAVNNIYNNNMSGETNILETTLSVSEKVVLKLAINSSYLKKYFEQTNSHKATKLIHPGPF